MSSLERAEPQQVWRPAVPADAEALRDLERDASLLALAHIFPPDADPYPGDAVLARWRRVIAEPGVAVEVLDALDGADGHRRLDCFVAYDDQVLRHLAVRPEQWGRGLGRAAVMRAEARMSCRRLWCLRDNARARGLYEHLGWATTGRERPTEWPPYPVEVEYAHD